MKLGNISENSPLGQALKKSIITTNNNNSSNNNGVEEERKVATASATAELTQTKSIPVVKNVDQPYHLTAAFQKKQPLSHQLQAPSCRSSSSKQMQQQSNMITYLHSMT